MKGWARGQLSATDREIRNKKTAQQAKQNQRENEANAARAKELENRLRNIERTRSQTASPRPTPAAPPPPKPEPVKDSSPIKQAKERVNKYQESIMAGAPSKINYGKGDYLSQAKADAGVASSPAEDKTEQAAQSFIDHKKYQFQAK